MELSLAMVTIIAAIISIGINAAVVKLSDSAAHFGQRNDLNAIQTAHNQPTSRLGGLGVFIGFGSALILLSYQVEDITPVLLLTSAFPVFFVGFLEDIGRDQSPLRRLLAAMISAVMSIIITNMWIKETGLPALDLLLSALPFAWAITIIWSAGVCNAFNLIDGINGLAGFIATTISVALAYLAWTAGDILMAEITLMLAGAIVGFLIFNWPWGNIFLGDAGAYSLGHFLVWISVIISWRNPDISYAALSLLFFWPVADTFLAMWRRSRRKMKMMHPDYLHVHQFAMRSIQIRWKIPLNKANPLTTLLLAPFFITPSLAAVYLSPRPLSALLAWLIFGVMFIFTYQSGIRRVRRQGWRKRRE